MMQMTPIGLVNELVERIKAIAAELRMRESDGEHDLRAPNVWAHSLPEKLYEGETDPADYPFALVVLGGGTGIKDGKAACNIGVLVGGYDDGQPLVDNYYELRDKQGWLHPAAIAWRIITSLAANPIIGPFELDLEGLTWDLPGQDQPAPQWFGIINMVWSVPVPSRQFNMENMPSHITHPCKGVMKEDILTFMEGE